VPRVQYNGPDPDGMDLVFEVDGEQMTVHVGQGKQAEVPAAVRDELKARDDWSVVKDPGGAKAKKESDS
jgi:hypothetical protein